MTLSAWHACVELQLTPRATSNFLDVVDILDDPAREPVLVRATLTSLEQAEPRLRVVAIPHLVPLRLRGVDDDIRLRAAELISDASGRFVGQRHLAR